MIKDINLIIKVCKLYFENELSFIQIGDLLKLSRFQVAGIIKKAKKTGIVKIIINDNYYDENAKLANLMEQTFNIRRVILVDNLNLLENELRKKIGNATSNFLIDILKDNDTIALTTSSTVNSIADSIHNKNNIRAIKIIEANGGSNISYSHSVHEISRKFAKIFNATHHSINAPIVVDSQETKKILLSEKNIKKTCELFNQVNILIVGIGTFYPKVNKLMLESRDLHKDEFLELKNLKAAGNLLYYYYDIAGNFLNTSFDNRIICFPKDKIKDVSYTVAVAYGAEKKYGLLGALRTGLIKFLVTDVSLARQTLEIKDLTVKEFEKLFSMDQKFNQYVENL